MFFAFSDHAFEMDDVPWPTVEAVGAAFAHADTDYAPIMPAEELEMPPNEYFSGFDQRCQTVRRRVERALSPAEGDTRAHRRALSPYPRLVF